MTRTQMMRRTVVFLAAAAALTLAASSASMAQGEPTTNKPGPTKPGADSDAKAPSRSAKRVVVDYTGRLQDEDGKPISGVFHLAFKLYDGEHAAQAEWSAQRYVAVVDGDYTVPLGDQRPLDRPTISGKTWIGVELVGEGELLRDPFEVGSAAAEQGDDKGSSLEISQETKNLLDKARTNKQIAFADVAERAVTADVAKRAEKVGDLTAEELEKKAQLALDRLGEHIADPDAHAATGGIRLGNDRRVMPKTGGDGGSPYQINCPPGYVVTGIKGGAGKMVDSVTVVCQKLR